MSGSFREITRDKSRPAKNGRTEQKFPQLDNPVALKENKIPERSKTFRKSFKHGLH